ncbi:MAG: hypothetical protein WAK84_10805 [Candidatus Cybelea sp.]
MMMMLRFGRFALVASAVAMSTGCGGTRGQTTVPGLPSYVAASRVSGDLLYVAHTEKLGANRYRGLLSVLTFPQGKPVTTIDLPGLPTGSCADAFGNLWVVAFHGHRHGAYEYAPGGTSPISTIYIPHTGGTTTSCAVDPTTGNLAVLSGFYEGGAPSHIDIWPGGRAGKPISYPIKSSPIACGYDASGNLFVDGYVGSTVIFQLFELPKGSDSIEYIKSGLYNFPGGIQWDGEYLAVFSGPVLYRLSVSGSVAHIVKTYRPRHAHSETPLAIADGFMVADSGGYGNGVLLWRYPGGGKATKRLAHLEYGARGLTVTAGSSPRHDESP